MLTDERRVALRNRFLSDIDRLMESGANIPANHREWCTQKRAAFFCDEKRTPGDGETGYMTRMLTQAGLIPRRHNRTWLATAKAADHHPEATAPACLQGSRKPTPMAPWLVTGVGLPLRPPPRRQAVST
jgi:hypothetical protein